MSKGTISNLRSGFATMELKGLEEYIENLQKAGKDIDAAVLEAVQASAQPVYNDIEAWAARHRQTGAVMGGVIKPEAKQNGNVISAEIGISGASDSWHGVFIEYGSPHNRPADPGIRTAFEKRLPEVKRIQRDVLKKAGVPTDG